MKVTDLRRKLMAALAAGGMLVPSTLRAADLNTNLVVNPGFENVNTAIHPPPNNPTIPLDLSPLILDWAGSKQGFAYSHNLTGGVPDYANGGPLVGGANYYFTSNATPTDITGPGQVFQDINVAGGATGTLIATGNAAFKVGGFFSGYLTNGDFGTIHVDFRNGSGVTLGTASISDSDTMIWGEDFNGGLIPVGTQTVRLSVFGTALAGGPDGYIDNVDFRVVNEVFQSQLTLTVDRDNGSMTLANRSGSPIHMSAYSITSAFEGLAPANWRSIADFYDQGNPGGEQVDSVHQWSELTATTAHGDLSEADLTTGAGIGTTLAHTRSINLSNGGAWIKTPTEDLVLKYISNGQIVNGHVYFVDNLGQKFVTGDLNTDNVINSTDWAILRTNQHASLSGQSLAEAYRLGDMNRDRTNNHADFVAFKQAFDAANGVGAFAAMLAGVPEPSSVILLMAAGLFAVPWARTRLSRS